MRRDRLRHRVEVAVQQIDDIVARPVVGDAGETAQIADQDGGAYRRPAAAPGGAGQDEVAGMRADIGFEQRSRQPVLERISLTSASTGTSLPQPRDMGIVKTSGPVGRKRHDMTLAERMVQRPRHIVGQTLRSQLIIDRVLAAERGIAFEILAHLGRAIEDFVGGTADVFGPLADVVVDQIEFGLAHPVSPQHPRAKPLRMLDQEMKRRPLDGDARLLEPDAQFGENVVDEALLARVVCQPVENVADRMRGDGIDGWRHVHVLLPGSAWIDAAGYVVSLPDRFNSQKPQRQVSAACHDIRRVPVST